MSKSKIQNKRSVNRDIEELKKLKEPVKFFKEPDTVNSSSSSEEVLYMKKTNVNPKDIQELKQSTERSSILKKNPFDNINFSLKNEIEAKMNSKKKIINHKLKRSIHGVTNLHSKKITNPTI